MGKNERRKGCKPKRAMNSYCIFIKEMRKNKEGRHLGFSEFAKLCANKWKQLSESQKYQYKMKAAADRRRYLNEKMKFRPLSLKANKKPMSAFFHYCNYERPKLKAKHPNWTLPQLSRELARKWKSASVNQKLKFKKMADKKMERFKRIVESSKNNMDDADERDDDSDTSS